MNETAGNKHFSEMKKKLCLHANGVTRERLIVKIPPTSKRVQFKTNDELKWRHNPIVSRRHKDTVR